MRSTTHGRIVTWKADKAYGFIRPVEGGSAELRGDRLVVFLPR
jgi:hypothetical protein